MRETLTFFLSWTALYVIVALIWNFVTYFTRGPESTISSGMEWMGRNYPIVPIALYAGLAACIAHFHWPVATVRDESPPPARIGFRAPEK